MKVKWMRIWALVIIMLVYVVSDVLAVTYTWTGAAGSNWTSSANWDPSSGAPSSWSDGAIFSNAPAIVNMPQFTTNGDVNNITFKEDGWTIGSASGSYNTRIGYIYAQSQTNGTNIISVNVRPWQQRWQVGAGGMVWITGNLTNPCAGPVNIGASGYTGFMKLSGDNIGYTGGFTVDYGSLDIASPTALGSGSFIMANANHGSIIANSSGDALRLTTANAITIDGSPVFAGPNDLNFGSGRVLVNRDITLNISTGRLTFEGAITSTAARVIYKSGVGTLVFSNVNYNTGNMQIDAGALQANDGVALNTTSFLKLNGGVLQSDGTASFIRVLGTSGNTFQWTSSGGGFSAAEGLMTVNIGNDQRELTWGATAGTTIYGTLKFGSQTANARTLFRNPVDLAGSTRTIEVTAGQGGDYAEMEGVIRTASITVGLVKTGSGKLVLSANNTYQGSTMVSNGTLTVDGALAAGAVEVDSNATLSGTGTLAGVVTVAQGATLLPGGDTGTMTIGSVAGQASLVLNGTLLAAGSVGRGTAPWLSVTGSVSIASSASLSSTNLNLLPDGGTYTILAFTGNRSGTFLANDLPSGWQIIYSGTSSGTISIRKGYPGLILNIY